ncbi:MAG: ADP-forming succinate--CoA ligase subunit beta [Verrucomicrobia bacterium]|nr:MAG: ADP-forming succinate--CoA ligase subunit beta [Verrucomicrobiota bacterium]PYK92428.1 MAG: ADP-forming succinate--CoA ligase subunit beta [Verrucomicrobiota bacterium]PYL38527.1 MAG: ADP-forming succinate--CoA ligase subunit beta [Verrucomicrobiota bacterium]PYL59199.1 MAG: ADP-forming succinate--CoA ligase subunit beta [Verrucomicrobiota bacterium]
MNIHEYQAKELLQKFGVATPRGKVASTPDEAEQIARELGDVDLATGRVRPTGGLVVKAQIHAGGRGKGTFTNGFKGGVHLCKSPAEVRELANKMLGQTLVTHQTGPAGRVVNKVLVAESAEIAREIYFAILLDRATAGSLVVASTEGGVEIETVAAKSPEKIIRESIDPLAGLQSFQARKLAKQLGFDSAQLKAAAKLFDGLFRTFIGLDCSMVEVNPLVVTSKGEVLALDAKFNFDDNALYRHPDIAAMRDIAEEDPREVEASKHGLNYIGLNGNIACLVNGAGLAMATMDIIKFYGGNPANFLDVGGGATEEQVTEAFKILIADKNVQAILVNIFGGIMKCDVIAQGIINAMKTVHLPMPLVVRLEGTNVEAGKKLIVESGLAVIAADDLADAARKAVAAASSKSQAPNPK